MMSRTRQRASSGAVLAIASLVIQQPRELSDNGGAQAILVYCCHVK